MTYLSTFGPEFENNILIFEIGKTQKKPLKFGIKNVLFGYFGARISKNFCHIWDQKCFIWVFFAKNALFGYFLARVLKNYCHVCNQHLPIWLTAKFCEEQKCLNLGPKMPYLGFFDQDYLILVFLSMNFKKTIVIFEITTLEFVKL